MSLSPEKTLAEKINIWMQIVGIVIAAVWAVYTFFFKEVVQPSSAPVNISMNLQFRKLIPPSNGILIDHDDLIAVEMMATATNPSSRELYLLPNVWIAWGNKFEKFTGDNFDDLVNQALKASDGNKMGEKYARITKPKDPSSTDTVASGRLFGDTVLKPNETITRRIVFHVPESFNVVDIWAAMPSTTEKDTFDIEWKFSANQLSNEVYCIVGGKKALFDPEKNGECPNNSDLQWSTSLASFSLWQ